LCREKERIADVEDCAKKRKEFQMGRGTVQNTNEQYHTAKSYFLIRRGRIPVISDDPVPLFNFLKTSPFPSNFIFN
jgi:hypothetical protein